MKNVSIWFQLSMICLIQGINNYVQINTWYWSYIVKTWLPDIMEFALSKPLEPETSSLFWLDTSVDIALTGQLYDNGFSRKKYLRGSKHQTCIYSYFRIKILCPVNMKFITDQCNKLNISIPYKFRCVFLMITQHCTCITAIKQSYRFDQSVSNLISIF
jgi:hypothetical protein